YTGGHWRWGDRPGETSVASDATNRSVRLKVGAPSEDAHPAPIHQPIPSPTTAAMPPMPAGRLLRVARGTAAGAGLDPTLDRVPAASSAKIRSRADWN